MITLEKVDVIRERTGVSYKEAKEALEENNNDLVEALIMLEEKHDRTWVDTMSIAGNEVMEKLKALIKKGNVSRVILKKDGEILLNVPVTAGAIGLVLYPIVSILGVSAALITKASIEIVKDNGEVVDINEIAEETVSEIKSMVKGKKGIDIEKTETSVGFAINKEEHEKIIDELEEDEYF